jgi:hypothetical protein
MPLPTASTLATGNHTVITSCDSCQNMRRRTRYRLKGDRWHHFVGACDGTSPEVRCECISSIYRDHQWLKKSQWGRRTAAPRLDVFFRQTVRAVHASSQQSSSCDSAKAQLSSSQTSYSISSSKRVLRGSEARGGRARPGGTFCTWPRWQSLKLLGVLLGGFVTLVPFVLLMNDRKNTIPDVPLLQRWEVLVIRINQAAKAGAAQTPVGSPGQKSDFAIEMRRYPNGPLRTSNGRFCALALNQR